jgi:CRISPR-associated protein Csb2
MSSLLCITFRFLDSNSAFHGSRDGSAPEWPPAPLRVFQALISAVASCSGQQNEIPDFAHHAFEWLEKQCVVSVFAPRYQFGSPFRIAVPNNDLDVWARPLTRGAEPKKQQENLKALRSVRATRLICDGADVPAVHYLIALPDGICPHFETIQFAARSVTHLGWGMDMVAGNAELLRDDEAERLPGEHWRICTAGEGIGLRVPKEGTLSALKSRHHAFLYRLTNDGFKPVPPLMMFNTVDYRRDTDPAPKLWAAFSILRPDASGLRAFDPRRRTRDVAGMVRHLVAQLARQQGWNKEKINHFVHGKTAEGDAPASGTESPDRFSYLALPTISAYQHRVESIRRVLVTAPSSCRQEIDWLRRALAGEELIYQGNSEGLLTILSRSDSVLKNYVGTSRAWATVTPVILPGHDDGRPAKTERVLKKAFRQSGFPAELIERSEWTWRRVGYHVNVDLASRYVPPENLNDKPRYHVKIVFPHDVAGPIAVGSGRFRGFGLFAVMDC